MGTFRVDESGDMGDAVRRTFEKIRKMFLPKNIFTSKGSIVVSTGADTPVELTVGSNTHVLTADSTTATGLKWALAGGGGGGGGDMLAANNLSELTATASTARGNISAETAGAAAAAQAAAIAASQPLDTDLTAIAALTTTTYGRSLLTGADAATTRTTLGLGTAATTASTAYEVAGAAAAAQAAAIAASQPLDADLTSIAALTTTTYGRSLLTGADAPTTRNTLGLGSAATTASTAYDPSGAAALAIAVSQPVNTNLTDISALTTTTYGRSLLTGADAATTRTTLGLGSAATTASTAYATSTQGTTADNAITKATVGAKGTIVTGTAASTPSGLVVGTNGQFLKADSTAGTGLVWATIPGGGDLLAANNLSELTATASTARTNLGLGTAATTLSTDYATSAQGTLATNAIPKSAIFAKGIILTGTAPSTPSALLVGTNKQIVVADSSTGTGLLWTDQPILTAFSSATTLNTATLAMANVTGMSFPVISGGRYWFKFFVPYTQTATSFGSRWWVTGPATTSLNCLAIWTGTATSTVAATRWGNLIGTPPVVTTVGPMAGGTATVEGMYHASAAGTVTLQFAISVATASQLTCLAGGFVQWRLLA